MYTFPQYHKIVASFTSQSPHTDQEKARGEHGQGEKYAGKGIHEADEQVRPFL